MAHIDHSTPVSLSTIIRLMQNGVKEDRTLEYKVALPGDSAEDRKEFLADVTAFSNASGGIILFGVEAPHGVPIALPGIHSADSDGVIRKYENILRDGIEPRLLGVRFDVMKREDGAHFFALRIPASWSGPHMVTFKGSSRFYTRNAGGKHQMDHGEIRDAFRHSSNAREQIRNWCNARVDKIASRILPVPLEHPLALVLHVVPVTAVSADSQIEPMRINRKFSMFTPIDANVTAHWLNADGLLVVDSVHSYAQAYYSGTVEAVDTYLRVDVQHQGSNVVGIAPGWYERHVIEATWRYMQSLAVLGVSFPMVVRMALVNVHGAVTLVPPRTHVSPRPIDRNVVMCPDLWTDELPGNVAAFLRPAFDRVWNACGVPQSLNYDASGNWIGEPLSLPESVTPPR